MKKKNVVLILSLLAVVLVVFAACGKNGKGKENEPETVTDANGQVYEQVTEIVTEVKSEVVSEVVTEVVTNKNGEKVTKKDGTPEIKSEVVTEIVTEIVSKVENITIPYTTQVTTKKGETTAEATTAEEFNTELLGSGTPVEVATNKDGRPVSSLLTNMFDKAKSGKQMMIKLYVSSQDMSDLGTMAYTFYVKGDKMAVEMSVPMVASLGALGSIGSIRAILNGNTATINFAKSYHYTTTLDDAEDMGLGTEIFDAIAAEGMDYKGTSKVKDGSKTYDCETYTDGTTTNKYYFTAGSGQTGKLARVEIISEDGTSTVMKVVDYSYSVSDKEFEAVGKAMSEEDLEKMFGSIAQ
ncbi:MAG TPA: hypothetical protein DDY98_02440 [Ruminococcaceae bacterium]|nr:hypothetical protein [Oscillospiraceae bacterium]